MVKIFKVKSPECWHAIVTKLLNKYLLKELKIILEGFKAHNAVNSLLLQGIKNFAKQWSIDNSSVKKKNKTCNNEVYINIISKFTF